MIEALPSADHVEQSVDIPDSITGAIVGALAHTVLDDEDEMYRFCLFFSFL